MATDDTSDARAFRSTSRDFLDKTMSSTDVRARVDSPESFDRAWWRQGAELGWTAMLVPESLGGGTVSGRPLGDLTLIAEEFGAHCAPGPLLTTSAVLTSLVRTPDRFEQTIGAILAGESIVGWADYEPAAGLRSSSYQTVATPGADGGYVVTGAKDRVEAALQADAFLVTAESPTGPVQLLVPADAPGITVSPTWSLDLSRRFARLDLDGVEVAADAVVHVGPDAVAAHDAMVHVAATLACAEMVGAVRAMFEVTQQWMHDRYTFGRPLDSYQALKHRMADNFTWLEACSATTDAAAAALDAGADDAAELVSVAKSYVSEKATAMIQDFVQLHGGIGITFEHDLHIYLRRVTCDRMLFGTPEDHRQLIANGLERTPL